MRSAATWLSRIDLNCRPELGWIDFAGRKGEAIRHHADDRCLRSIEQNLAVHNRGITGKRPFPKTIRDVHHKWRLWVIILEGDQSSHNGRYTQGLEGAAAHERSRGAHGIGDPDQVRAGIHPGIERLPRLGFAFQVEKLRWREPE